MKNLSLDGKEALFFAREFDYIREAGTEGSDRAAVQLEQAIRCLGAEPTSEAFSFPSLKTDASVLTVNGKEYTVGACTARGRLGTVEISAPLLYAENCDPISLMNAEGKLVLVNGPMRPPLAEALTAAGAAGFLTWTGTPLDTGADLIPRHRFLPPDTKLSGGVLHYIDAAEIAELQGDVSARLRLSVSEATAETRNVCCRIEGTDPALKEDILTVTAHYDSVPAGVGAYDNMAACSIVYALLADFLKRPASRTMEFIFLAAEEKGLLGSREYVKRHENELPRHRFNMNIDLAGQGLGGNIFGVTAGHDVDEILLKLARETGIGASVKNQIWASDSNTFAACGIPAMTLNRDGFGMHTSHDTFDLLSARALDRSIRQLGHIARSLADADPFPFPREVPQEYLEALNRHF